MADLQTGNSCAKVRLGAPLKRALRRGNALHPVTLTRGHVQRPSKGLKKRLDTVVIVLATQQVEVQVHPGLVGYREEKLAHQCDRQFANTLVVEGRFQHQIRAARQIDRSPGQGLVHRHIAMPVSDNPGLVAEGLCNRLAQSNSDIHYCVMGVDMQITLAFDL